MSAADRREELEAAVHEALGKAWRTAIAYLASNMTHNGVPLGYPQDCAETAKILAAADAYAEAVASERITGRERLARAAAEKYRETP